MVTNKHNKPGSASVLMIGSRDDIRNLQRNQKKIKNTVTSALTFAENLFEDTGKRRKKIIRLHIQ